MSIQSLPAYISDKLVPLNADCCSRVTNQRSTRPLDICSSPVAGNLVARPFDLTRLEFSGDPIPLFPLSSFAKDWRGWIPVSASDTGRLTHVIVEIPPTAVSMGGAVRRATATGGGAGCLTTVLISRRTVGGSRSHGWGLARRRRVSGCTTWSTTACNVSRMETPHTRTRDGWAIAND